MHGWRHQDSMNTFAHEKRRWGKEAAVNPLASPCLTDSIVLFCFLAAEGLTSTLLLPPHRRREERRRPGHTHTHPGVCVWDGTVQYGCTVQAKCVTLYPILTYIHVLNYKLISYKAVGVQSVYLNLLKI